MPPDAAAPAMVAACASSARAAAGSEAATSPSHTSSSSGGVILPVATASPARSTSNWVLPSRIRASASTPANVASVGRSRSAQHPGVSHRRDISRCAARTMYPSGRGGTARTSRECGIGSRTGSRIADRNTGYRSSPGPDVPGSPRGRAPPISARTNPRPSYSRSVATSSTWPAGISTPSRTSVSSSIIAVDTTRSPSTTTPQIPTPRPDHQRPADGRPRPRPHPGR